MKKRKLFEKILAGSKNIRFAEATSFAEAFGFRLDRINGSHHIFVHPDIPELINFQDVKGKVKSYQLKQLRQLQNSIIGVTPAKAGVQKFLKRLDSRFRGNDNLGLLQLAKLLNIIEQHNLQMED